MLKHLTKDVLHQLYVVQGLPTTMVAKELHTTTTTIRQYLKRYGIPFRDSPTRPKDIANQRFGRLVAVYPSSPDRFGKSRWHCVCDCGRTTTINYASLVRGLATSCGCRKVELCRRGGYKDISRAWWRRIIKNAAMRGYVFNLTPEEVWEIYEGQGRRCAFTHLPVEFFPDSNRVYHQTASLDRIDSSLGYVKGNIQIVHKIVNQMKSYLSDDEFVAFCNEVARTKPMDHDACLAATSRTVMRKSG